MHAIVAEFPAKLIWTEVPERPLQPGEVRIDVVAAGINRADLLQAAGKYPPPKGASDIMGLEVSGIITDIADDVSGWAVGQPVCALLGTL